uniref:Thiol oxidoreductase, DsbA family, FrnE subfamily n=1 Tax=uncultured bacterium Contig1491 TaxID=1393439 RepID=W0FJ80_9BACT|nr:thiol oxidoreductase, DsbA family, FrnE subfamily [uncultured bacterium Contig1491]
MDETLVPGTNVSQSSAKTVDNSSAFFSDSRDNLVHMEKKLSIAHFTDPLCFWCYAMEPEIRKVRVLLDGQLDYRIVMGVLSADVHDFIGYDAETELRYELFRAQIAEHLMHAAQAIGMPFSLERLTAGRPEEFVSLPLCLAYCAMSLIDKTIAEAYLRRMRECVYAEGRSLSTVESQVELAKEFPIDIEQFRSNLEDGAAVPVLQEGVDECKAYNVVAFPTLLFQYGEQRAMTSGYFDFAALRDGIAQLTNGEISLSDAEFSLHALEGFVDRFGKVAAREIQTMFSLNEAQLANAMMDLVSTGCYKTESCGGSYFVMPRHG